MNEGKNAKTASVKNRARIVVCISGCALSQRRDQGISFTSESTDQIPAFQFGGGSSNLILRCLNPHPVEQFGNSLFQGNCRFVSQQALRFRNIRNTVPDIAFSVTPNDLWLNFNVEPLRQQFANCSD